MGVVFDRPLSWDEAREVAASRDAAFVAVWVADPLCVAHGQRRENRWSSFAYYEADDLVARRQTFRGPPITDGGTTFALWEQWQREWDSARIGTRRLLGAALLLPAGATPLKDRRVRRVEPVPTYPADGGVLFLRGHVEALAPLFPETPRGPC